MDHARSWIQRSSRPTSRVLVPVLTGTSLFTRRPRETYRFRCVFNNLVATLHGVECAVMRNERRVMLLGGTSQLGFSIVRRHGIEALTPFCSVHSRYVACEHWPRVNLDDAEARN